MRSKKSLKGLPRSLWGCQETSGAFKRVAGTSPGVSRGSR